MATGDAGDTKEHVVDETEWNEGQCGKCGDKTPYCSRCGATWCLGCESQLCPVALAPVDAAKDPASGLQEEK